MKRVGYWSIVIFLLWFSILPHAIVAFYGRIWSIEGFLKLDYYWQPKKILGVCLILFILTIIVLYLRGRLIIKYEKCHYLIKIFVPIMFLIVACLNWLYVANKYDISLKQCWFEKNTLVAHAFGGIEGRSYTNCYEAFEQNYKNGYRVFEVDMCVTSDGYLVAEHDWKTYYEKLGEEYTEGAIPTHEEFMSSKYHGKYSPVDLDMMIDMMVKYDDIYIMTDFKDPFQKESVSYAFSQIVQSAEESGCPDILERFIVQVYSEEFKVWVDSIYRFDNYLYTGYLTSGDKFTPENMVTYCANENIPVITMWTFLFNDDWYNKAKDKGIQIYVHTENNIDAANEFIDNGVSGIYTDFIDKEQIGIPKMKKTCCN